MGAEISERTRPPPLSPAVAPTVVVWQLSQSQVVEVVSVLLPLLQHTIHTLAYSVIERLAIHLLHMVEYSLYCISLSPLLSFFSFTYNE